LFQHFDFSNNAITPAREIVDNHVGGLKTVSNAPVPCSEQDAAALASWKNVSLYS